MNQQSEKRYTETQGQYLAFIYNDTVIHGRAPAEADMERFFGATPPSIHQMILKLAQKGLISRVARQSRSIQLMISAEELPILKRRERADASC